VATVNIVLLIYHNARTLNITMNTFNHNFNVCERERERGGESKKVYQAINGITVMCHIKMFRSTTHRIYDGGPIRL
jgi:hypothetical protein